MHRYARGTVAAAVVGVTLAAMGVANASEPSYTAVITVTQPASGAFTVSQTGHRPGPVRFHFVSHKGVDADGNGGMDIALVQPNQGVTIADVERHIAQQQGPGGAASTRWLVAHAQFLGGTGIEGTGSTDTVNDLPAGTIYAVDTNAVFGGKDPAAAPTTALHISGAPFQSPVPVVSSTISMTTSDKFQVTSTHLGSGRYLVRNHSDTLHFAVFQPVKPGTTDADITKVANAEAHGQPPASNPYLGNKPGVNSDVLSPGRSEIFDSAQLTPGTYDLECFIADDQTGMPHFFMGMHKIVVIP